MGPLALAWRFVCRRGRGGRGGRRTDCHWWGQCWFAADTGGVLRSHNSTALADLFDEVDALVTPTTSRVAHAYDQHEENLMVVDLCWGFNLTGHPAVSVPVGLVDGLPVGAQVIAPHGRDEVALSVAAQLMAPGLSGNAVGAGKLRK